MDVSVPDKGNIMKSLELVCTQNSIQMLHMWSLYSVSHQMSA